MCKIVRFNRADQTKRDTVIQADLFECSVTSKRPYSTFDADAVLLYM